MSGATIRIHQRHEFDKVIDYLNRVPTGRAYLSTACVNSVIPAGNLVDREQFSDRLAAFGQKNGVTFKRELKKTKVISSPEGDFVRCTYHYLVTKAA